MRARRLAMGCLVIAAILAMTSLWLLMANASVDVQAHDVGEQRPAGSVGCSIAPYDAGFYGNDGAPGGEHSADYSTEVATECYQTNMRRFSLGVALAVTSLLSATVAVGALTRARRQPALRH